jgi:hypothetical protein
MTEARILHKKADESSIVGDASLPILQVHLQAWHAFAKRTTHMIPVLKAQMFAVTQETERAVIELLVHLQAFTSSDQSVTSKDCPDNISKVVMAMQFQDITRQKLEHVGLALDQLKGHLQILSKGPLNEEDLKAIAALESFEQNYSMEAERRLHQQALKPDYGEPVPMDVPNNEVDSVTLF